MANSSQLKSLKNCWSANAPSSKHEAVPTVFHELQEDLGLFGQRLKCKMGLFGQRLTCKMGLFGQRLICKRGLFGQRFNVKGAAWPDIQCKMGLFGQRFNVKLACLARDSNVKWPLWLKLVLTRWI